MTGVEPVRTAADRAGVLLVLTAWAFLPMAHLPSFDAVKLAVLVPGAAVLTLLAARRREGRDPLADPLLLLPLGLALAAAALALAAGRRGSLDGPLAFLAAVAVARVVAKSKPPVRTVRSVARAAAVAAAGAGLYALLQRAGLDPAPWGARREVVSTFGNTSFAAEFQAAALPLALLLVLRPGRPRLDRTLGGAAAALAAVHLGLAVSRIDLVGAGAGVAVAGMLLLHGTGRQRAARALAWGAGGVAAAAAAAFVVAAAGGPSLVGRSDTLAVRAHVWSGTGRMLADAPLGLLGTPFRDAFPAWRSPEEYRISLGRVVDTPHSDLLHLATALGPLGLAVGLAGLVLLARRVARAARTAPPEAAAVGGAAAALLVSGLASSPLTHPATALLGGLALGGIVGLEGAPLRLPARALRGAGIALGVALLAGFWPGPALRGLRSDGFLALGRAEVAAGDAARAMRLLDAAAAVDASAFAPRWELGVLLAGSGQTAAGIGALESARALRPGSPEAACALADALRLGGRPEAAGQVLEEALAAVPWHPLLRASRAALRVERGRAEDAVADLDAALPLLPPDVRLRVLRAQALLLAEPREDTYEEALDALEALHEAGDLAELGRAARWMSAHAPTVLPPLVLRARRLAPTNPERSIALLLAAASADSRHPDFLTDAARVVAEAGRPDAADVLLGRALGVRSEEALARGDPATALRLGHKAVERAPEPRQYLAVARAAARLGERGAAVEAVGAAVAAGPVDPAAVRGDPVLSGLLPDPDLELVLERAGLRAEGRR